MYDIPELEKKWRKYKRKQIQKPIIMALSAVAIIGGASYFGIQYLSNSPESNATASSTNANNKAATTASTQQNQIQPQKVPVQNARVQNQALNQQQNMQQQQPVGQQNMQQHQVGQQVQQTRQQPMAQQQQQAPFAQQNSNTPAIVIEKIPKTPEVYANDTVVDTTKQTNQNQQQNANANPDGSVDLINAEIAKLNVPDEETRIIGFNKNEQKNIKNKYQDLLEATPTNKALKEKAEIAIYEERFKSTQDPNDSLYLAKYYYKKGEYEKAETWAVNTNNVDGDIEDSWIIFAKARAKQGHRVDAIKVLQSYYDETKSPKAKALLDKLRRNKPFK